MMHLEAKEVCDRKRISIGIIEKRETQSGKHWGDACEVIKTVEERGQFF